MIFIDNKYTKWYFQLIFRAQTRILPRTDYRERHHIIPKSLGGSDNSENLVPLTAREHFICHWLLTKMLTGKERSPMVYALFAMRTGHSKQHRYHTKITSRAYSTLKKERSSIVSKQLTGRPVSQETKHKMSASQKGIPRKLHSEETKAKMSVSQRNRPPDSIETRLKKSLASTGNNHNLGRKMSDEQKIKLRRPKPPRTAEHRAKLSEAAKNRKQSHSVI